MNYYFEAMKTKLTALYNRVSAKSACDRQLTVISRPPALRRTDPLIQFNYCVKRRQGYMLIFNTDEFVEVSLPDHTATNDQLEQLDEVWERSLSWPPIQVQAMYEDGTWAMRYNLNPGVAQFLQSKGVATLRVQLYETVDVPASNEKRAALESNLLGFNGKPITPIKTAITL